MSINKIGEGINKTGAKRFTEEPEKTIILKSGNNVKKIADVEQYQRIDKTENKKYAPSYTGNLFLGSADGLVAPGPGVPEGGTAGQFLRKSSGTDFDTDWVDLPSGPDLSDYVESQTVTTVAVLTQTEYDSILIKDQNTLYFIKAD